MKTLSLKVMHRVLLSGLINAKGSKPGNTLSELAKLTKLDEKFVLTPEEVAKLNYRLSEPDKGGNRQILWNTKDEATGKELDLAVSIEVSDDEAAKLKEIIKAKNDAKEFTKQEAEPITELATQLELDIA